LTRTAGIRAIASVRKNFIIAEKGPILAHWQPKEDREEELD
jgi:hypothetical protein